MKLTSPEPDPCTKNGPHEIFCELKKIFFKKKLVFIFISNKITSVWSKCHTFPTNTRAKKFQRVQKLFENIKSTVEVIVQKKNIFGHPLRHRIFSTLAPTAQGGLRATRRRRGRSTSFASRYLYENI